MSDAPTQRLSSPGDEEPEPHPQPSGRRNRTLLIVLIVVGAVLVIAVVVLLLILLLGGGKQAAVATSSPTPTASSASATPSATASTIRPPGATTGGGSGGGSSGGSGSGSGAAPAAGGAFTAVSAKSPVTCSKGGPDFNPPPIPIQVSWSTVRTQSVWIVQGTGDAADSQYMKLPPSGNQSSFSNELDYPCFQPSATWTLTLVGDDGKHVSRSFTIANIGDKN